MSKYTKAQSNRTAPTVDSDAQNWLNQHAEFVLKTLTKGKAGQHRVAFRRLSRAPEKRIFEIVLDGTAYVIKGFDPSDKTSKTAFEREYMVLKLLQGTGLVPTLLGQSASRQLVIMARVDGKTVRDAMRPDSVVEISHKIGQWHASYDRHMQHMPCDTNWAAYFDNYPTDEIAADLRDPSGPLAKLPIRAMCIAKNDAFLENFLVDTTGNLMGIDFEAAVVKPVGWDVLLLARTLLREYPQAAQTATHALVRGWGQGTESLDLDTFEALAHRFAKATVHLGQ